MEPNPPFSFSDFPEDVQLCILSYLHQSDLEEFARTSKKLFDLCYDDERLWFIKCTRRWGSQTRIQKWGGGGKISYKSLFRFLNEYESLIGFWRSDHEAISSPPLVLFEWGSFYMIGYQILPQKRGGYGLRKKPFLWITATSNGKALNYLDTNGTLSLTDKDLFTEDSEKFRATELIIVNIDLSANGYLSISENPHFLAFRQRLSSTGTNHMSEYEEVYRSPPDGLMTQIYKILAKNVKVTGNTTSKKEMKRIRRKEKEKLRMSVLPWKSEHFEKIIHCSPTLSRPLQGLWKGIGADGSLGLYSVSYHEEWEEISCEIVGSFFSPHLSPFRGIVISASITACLQSPFSYEEINMYNSRSHLHSLGRSDPTCSDVLHIFYADSGLGPLVPDLSENPQDGDGRVWVYADGCFGFGFSRHDYIMDLEPMVKNGHFLDTYVLL